MVYIPGILDFVQVEPRHSAAREKVWVKKRSSKLTSNRIEKNSTNKCFPNYKGQQMILQSFRLWKLEFNISSKKIEPIKRNTKIFGQIFQMNAYGLLKVEVSSSILSANIFLKLKFCNFICANISFVRTDRQTNRQTDRQTNKH